MSTSIKYDVMALGFLGVILATGLEPYRACAADLARFPITHENLVIPSYKNSQRSFWLSEEDNARIVTLPDGVRLVFFYGNAAEGFVNVNDRRKQGLKDIDIRTLLGVGSTTGRQYGEYFAGIQIGPLFFVPRFKGEHHEDFKEITEFEAWESVDGWRNTDKSKLKK